MTMLSGLEIWRFLQSIDIGAQNVVTNSINAESSCDIKIYAVAPTADDSDFSDSHDPVLLVSKDAETDSSSFAAIGCSPQRLNITLSSSQPLQSVVNIFSPVKIAFAPDMKHSICFSSLIVILPAASLMIVFGNTSLAVAIVLTIASKGIGSLSPSG